MMNLSKRRHSAKFSFRALSCAKENLCGIRFAFLGLLKQKRNQIGFRICARGSNGALGLCEMMALVIAATALTAACTQQQAIDSTGAAAKNWCKGASNCTVNDVPR